MFTYLRQRISTRLILSLVAGFVILAAVLLTPSLAPAKHKITWKPSSVTETIVAGESKTVSVTFKTRRKLKNLVVHVSPELEPFVQVDPQEFRKIRKKKKNKLTITISAPAGSLPGTIQGTIQLKELKKGKPTKKSLARTLPVILNIEWPVLTREDFGYGVAFPADWSFSALPKEQTGKTSVDTVLFGPQDQESSVSNLTINVIETSLEEYLALLNRQSLVEVGREFQRFNGLEWLIIHFTEQSLPRSYLSAFTEKNGRLYQIVFIEGSDEDQAVFIEMLRTFKFSN